MKFFIVGLTVLLAISGTRGRLLSSSAEFETETEGHIFVQTIFDDGTPEDGSEVSGLSDMQPISTSSLLDFILSWSEDRLNSLIDSQIRLIRSELDGTGPEPGNFPGPRPIFFPSSLPRVITLSDDDFEDQSADFSSVYPETSHMVDMGSGYNPNPDARPLYDSASLPAHIPRDAALVFDDSMSDMSDDGSAVSDIQLFDSGAMSVISEGDDGQDDFLPPLDVMIRAVRDARLASVAPSLADLLFLRPMTDMDWACPLDGALTVVSEDGQGGAVVDIVVPVMTTEEVIIFHPDPIAFALDQARAESASSDPITPPFLPREEARRLRRERLVFLVLLTSTVAVFSCLFGMMFQSLITSRRLATQGAPACCGIMVDTGRDDRDDSCCGPAGNCCGAAVVAVAAAPAAAAAGCFGARRPGGPVEDRTLLEPLNPAECQEPESVRDVIRGSNPLNAAASRRIPVHSNGYSVLPSGQ